MTKQNCKWVKLSEEDEQHIVDFDLTEENPKEPEVLGMGKEGMWETDF